VLWRFFPVFRLALSGSLILLTCCTLSLWKAGEAMAEAPALKDLLGDNSFHVLPDAHTFNLKNGLSLVVIPEKRSPVVTQVVIYKVGGADDPPGKSGLAHYLEHLMFKTTTTSGGKLFSDRMRSIGDPNASTTLDYTQYSEQVLSKDLRTAMELEADRMANLLIDSEAASTELQVVLEERLRRVESNPARKLWEEVTATLFRVSPYRTPTIGWKHDLEGLTPEDARKFYDTWYSPDNAVVLVFGDVEPGEVKTLAEEIYGELPRRDQETSRRRIRPQEPVSSSSERTVSVKIGGLSALPGVSMNWLVPSRLSGVEGESEAIDVLCQLLSGGISGRLYKQLVLEKKLAIYVACSYSGSTVGDTMLSIGVVPSDKGSLEILRQKIDEIIDKVLSEGVTDEELLRAKRRIIGSFVHAQDGQVNRASLAARALASGMSIEDVNSFPTRLYSVDEKAVRRIIREYMKPERLVVGYLIDEKFPSKETRERKTTGLLQRIYNWLS